ncbi:carboxypeptidase-like regulatory domain-containing protein [Chryseobacterium sp.]|uniref:carboxypeptidase-like regulatory domain-containing protein n=1 Tax=Chryseobacterium sp. TaxID=1871047 RepID=UPI002FCB55BD
MKNILKYLMIVMLGVLASCSEDLIGESTKGIIKGTVVKKGTNTPLANVKISTSPTTTTTFTGTDGSFVINDAPTGDYSVKAEYSGYVTSYQGVNLQSEGQTVTVVFELSDDTSLNSAPSIPVLVSPADNSTEQPLSLNLSWTSTDPDNDSLKFDLILKNANNTIVQNINGIKTKNYNVTNLQYNNTYFWQVSVSDGVNPKVYSETRQFKTIVTPTNRFHYTKRENGNYFIVSANESNGNFNITSASQNSFRPRLNNDANRLAFLRNVAGNFQIFTSKRDGSDIMQVTNLPATGFSNAEIDFSWNKVGSQLIYANFDKLYRINSDGTGLSLIYSTPDGSLISECDWSYDGSKIALKTNNLSGYGVKIFIINMSGNIVQSVLSGVNGGAGGLNFSADSKKLLYTRDIAGFESIQYRQLDSRIFIYNLEDNTQQDISAMSQKINGTNDLDPRFAPNDAEVILVNTSNDNMSTRNIVKISLTMNNGNYPRAVLFTDAEMPDWE